MSEHLSSSSAEQAPVRDQAHVREVLKNLQDVRDPRIHFDTFNQALNEAGYTVRVADFKNPIKIPRSDGGENEGFLGAPGLTEEGDVYVTARIYEEGQKVEEQILLEDIENYTRGLEVQDEDAEEEKRDVRSAEWKRQQARATQRKGRGTLARQKRNRRRGAAFEGHDHSRQDDNPSPEENPESDDDIQTGKEEQLGIDPELEKWAQEYLKDIDIFEGEGFKKLANARAAVAEASVKGRRSSLLYSRSRREKQLRSAIETYKRERQTAFEDLLAKPDENTPLLKKKALLTQLSSREDGALMGEEANYYLTKEDSWSQRMMEKYKSMSKWKRMTVGLGATAVVGLGAGVVGGVGAVGAVVGARVGRGYANREAQRSKNVRSREEKEQESTLKQSNMDDYISMYQNLKALRSRDVSNKITATKDEDLLHAAHENSDIRFTRSNEAYFAQMDEAEKERYRKHRSLIWAVGGAAVGALAGSLLEDILDSSPEGPGDVPGETDNEALDAALDEREDLIEEREGLIDQIEQAEDQVAELEAQADAAPEVSPELQGLFGELAGERIEITIPEGSNVWDQLELLVDQEAPDVSFDEKQRLVGNMVERLQQQYPGRDLNLVYPGETFVTELR